MTLLVIVLTLPLGCSAPRRAPASLVDGRRAQPPPPQLRALGSSAVLTEVRTVASSDLSPAERRCVRGDGSLLGTGWPLVERVDVRSITVTFRPVRGRFVYGCMSSGRRKTRDIAWCGHAYGPLRGGRLTDPRLDVSCRDARGRPWASAWIEPVPGARWIVVDGNDPPQIYPAAVNLPVRVTTTSVDLPSATATFRVEQYDGSGRRVSFSILRAAVAG
ncbi:MAG TPA: hypothetical protein VEH79_02265 [Gaiellaceae bacterium]|nr:hypothetical protein [Gaiellaceae bacterium]